MHILDAAILEQCLRTDLSDGTIRDVVETGHWNGMPIPGTSEWQCNDPGMPNHRLYVLGLAHYTRRHPSADQILVAIAADVLHTNATHWPGPYPVEEDPRHEQAYAWLMAIAGGRPSPPGGTGFMFTPPIEPTSGQVIVPGGRDRFTRFAVELIDRLLFIAPQAAEAFAQDYLALYQAEPIAQQADVIFSHVKQWRGAVRV